MTKEKLQTVKSAITHYEKMASVLKTRAKEAPEALAAGPERGAVKRAANALVVALKDLTRA
jgi:hypothetical protein